MSEYTIDELRRAERVLFSDDHRTSGLSRLVAQRALDAGMALPEEPKWVVGVLGGVNNANIYWSEDSFHARFTAWTRGSEDRDLAKRLVETLNEAGFKPEEES